MLELYDVISRAAVRFLNETNAEIKDTDFRLLDVFRGDREVFDQLVVSVEDGVHHRVKPTRFSIFYNRERVTTVTM